MLFRLLTFAAALVASVAAVAPSAADAQRRGGHRVERRADPAPPYRAAPRFDRREYRSRQRRCEARGYGGVIGAIAGGLSGNSTAAGGGFADRPGRARRCR